MTDKSTLDKQPTQLVFQGVDEHRGKRLGYIYSVLDDDYEHDPNVPTLDEYETHTFRFKKKLCGYEKPGSIITMQAAIENGTIHYDSSSPRVTAQWPNDEERQRFSMKNTAAQLIIDTASKSVDAWRDQLEPIRDALDNMSGRQRQLMIVAITQFLMR